MSFRDRMAQQVAELDEGITRQLNLEGSASNALPQLEPAASDEPLLGLTPVELSVPSQALGDETGARPKGSRLDALL